MEGGLYFVRRPSLLSCLSPDWAVKNASGYIGSQQEGLVKSRLRNTSATDPGNDSSVGR